MLCFICKSPKNLNSSNLTQMSQVFSDTKGDLLTMRPCKSCTYNVYWQKVNTPILKENGKDKFKTRPKSSQTVNHKVSGLASGTCCITWASVGFSSSASSALLEFLSWNSSTWYLQFSSGNVPGLPTTCRLHCNLGFSFVTLNKGPAGNLTLPQFFWPQQFSRSLM